MGKVRHTWSEENMKTAVEKVCLKEMSIREASERFSVPKSTLGDRLKQFSEGKEVELKPKLGNSKAFATTFSGEQEAVLYAHIKTLDSQLMPLSKEEFLKLVYQFAEKIKIKHRFNKEKMKAGKDYYYDFMKRHPDLRLRTAESTSLQRAAGFSKEQVDRFFYKLSELMDKYKFSPCKIFNADETGVTVVHTNKLRVISVKGKKQVGKLTSGERGKNVTILLSVNAAGDVFIPPLFVFPRVRMDNDLTKDAPVGSVFDAQPSGWITKDGFLKWLVLFVERVNPTEKSPALLIVDGHSSHKDLDVLNFAKEHHIHMLSLPPHTSHKLQPLDRSVMKPFKNAYHEACSHWMRQYPNMKINLKDIASLVSSAFSRICRMELARSGFQCTGIFPLHQNIFSDLDYAPSLNKSSESTGTPSNSSGSGSSFATIPLPGPSFAAVSLPGPLSAVSFPGPSSAVSLPGPSSAVSSPGSSSDVHFPGPSSAMSLPGPSSAVSFPGPSSAVSFPSPSSAVSLPGPSSAVFFPGPSSTVSLKCPLSDVSLPGPSSAVSLLGPSYVISSPAPSPAHNYLSSLSEAAFPESSNHDPAIVSPKRSPAQKILEVISPLPSHSSSRFESRHNRGEKSEILTSSPYKKQLEIKKEEQEEKKKAAEAKRKLKEEKRKLKEGNIKNQTSKKPVGLAETKLLTDRKIGKCKRKVMSTIDMKKSSENAKKKLKLDTENTSDDVTHCIICDETFEEDWIQCRLCKGWSHENCADLESRALYYECDSCHKNKSCV